MELDYTEGRLFLHKREWFLDAEPHVLVLFERLFPSSRILYEYKMDEVVKLKFTHRPRVMKDSMSVRKDLLWFIDRYDLTIDPKFIKLLKTGSNKYDKVMQDSRKAYFEYTPVELNFALPLRPYQEQAVALTLHKKNILIADQVGLGKTIIGIAIGYKNLPAVCVVPPHLVSQWEFEIKKFLPKARICTIRSWKDIERLPEAEFYIDAYSRIYKGADHLLKIKPKSLILDEVHSLRRNTTKKYESVKAIANVCKLIVGLSATPIMNYGTELYNIYGILDDGCLGDSGSFMREWCDWGKIRDPELLGNFLRKNFLMLRRTRKDVDKQLGDVNRIIYNVDANMETLKAFDEEAKILAMKVITGDFKEAGESAREFDYKLRQATGIAKAKAVAEVVKMVVESGEKVVLFGWHRACYDIWLDELGHLGCVMYTGSETIKKKEESLKEFVEGDAKIFIISLRSGAGINRLQEVSSYAIFGELDWSSGVIDQCIGRLWRDGQENKVTAMFITIDDGSDPVMKKVIGAKSMEAKKILSPEAQVLATNGDKNKVLGLAKEWLKKKGVDVDTIIEEKEKQTSGEMFIGDPQEGMVGFEVWNLIKNSILSVNDELDLQNEIEDLLTNKGISYDREFSLSKQSRVDFKVGSIFIECKAGSFSKRNMLRQIKRYKNESEDIKAMIVVTPNYMKNFKLKDLPVYMINTSDSSLLMGGLS